MLSEFGEPATTAVLHWVDGCLFEIPAHPPNSRTSR
jgi:hypothetical protein